LRVAKSFVSDAERVEGSEAILETASSERMDLKVPEPFRYV
jgi:hypothetical protein